MPAVKGVEAKAVRIVVSGGVKIYGYNLDTDGTLLTANGVVRGTTGLWLVHIKPDATSCTCPYGQARLDAAGHSHDRALGLAIVQREKERQ